ncbi:MAG TPA: hypothetical protein VFY06_08500 [Verrucomicrobiae bacterium]|nr:hypothetical protein [Verrucomicrobiae bacterium]
MTTPGWIIMLSSVGAVTVLFVWCLYRVLAHKPPARGLHGIDDIVTNDDD